MTRLRKVCTKCAQPRPLSHFYTRTDGSLYAHCKPCHIELCWQSRQKAVDELSEGYVRTLLKVKADEKIHPDLIVAKRLQVQLRRMSL